MRCRAWRPLVALAGVLSLPAAAGAQEGFVFRQPMVQLSLRVGASLPRASGPLFDDMRDRLTLGTSDFAAEALAGEIMFRVHRDVDVGGGMQWSQSSAESEYRDWLYEDDSPIEQVTKLRRAAFSVLGRAYPFGRGEALAQYAWVPKRVTPFVGGGAGVSWYRLRQYGDFVNEETLDIFSNEYESSGSALAAQVLAGTDIWLTPALALTAEARYTFASDDPGGDFARTAINPTGYDEIDLGGAVLTAGLTFRF